VILTTVAGSTPAPTVCFLITNRGFVMPHTVYLSARWDRREEMRQVRDVIRLNGHEVVARWLDEVDGTPPHLAAGNDLDDINFCTAIILFSEKPDIGYYTGGRHVELGFALASGTMHIIAVGPRENIFFHLPQVDVVDDVMKAIELLDESDCE
jgi:hypothetical protein